MREEAKFCLSLRIAGVVSKNLMRMAATTSINVEARRLDAVLDLSAVDYPVLIKLDVPGCELRALQGADGLLDQVACLKIEFDFDQLYVGQSSTLDLFTFVLERGFSRFIQVHTRTSESVVRRCDMLFFRDRRL